jgi:integrase
MANWQRTQYPGVYFRAHATRKHGVGPDKYFSISYRLDGKKKWDALGWASDGMKPSKAATILAELKENQRTGRGPRTLAEKRQLAEEGAAVKEVERLRLEAESKTFSDFWKEAYWPAQSGKSEGSKTAEQGLYKHWLKPVIGDKPLAFLAPFDLERVKSNMLKAGKSPSTVKYALAVVSQVWSLAARDGVVDGFSPTKKVKLPKLDNRRDRFLSPDEAKSLLEALKERSPLSHDMAVMALFAGLRFGEIAALTWRDVDLSRGILFIRDPKARVNRQAFITGQMRAVLEQRVDEGAKPSGLVFPDANGKKQPRVSNTFRKVANELFNQGVEDKRQRVCFHTLRHSFASWLVENGTSLYAVKELMGHADFKMTQRYSHLAPDGLRSSVVSLDNIFIDKKNALWSVSSAWMS